MLFKTKNNFGRRAPVGRKSTRAPLARKSTTRRSRRARFESLEQRALLTAVDALRITELMFHPAPDEHGARIADDFEYIELLNIGSTPIDLSSVQFTSGVQFDFAASTVQTLGPSQRLLVVADEAGFKSRYGADLPIAGVYTGHLSDRGEQLRLMDGAEVIHDFSYRDDWQPHADGDGFSLIILDPTTSLDAWGNGASWRASLRGGGSPGVVEPTPRAGDVVINELLAHTDEALGDWIELHNPTTDDVNLSGWYISDNASNLTRYRISDGVFIRAGGYLTFTEVDAFRNPSDPGAINPFGFSELGEEAHVSSWDAFGSIAAYQDSVFFDASDREVAFGRHVLSDNSVAFVAMERSTFGEANSTPLVGPIVLNEIMYHPTNNLSQDEFIELLNITDAPVSLFDPLHPENTWNITSGVSFIFPPNVSIPARGFLLLVGGDPDDFRIAHNVPADVPILGPFGGSLNNAGERVELRKPGDPEPFTGFVPMYLADLVRYNDKAPWPESADGEGPSLERASSTAYGDDAVNWKASRRLGGTPGAANAGIVRVPGDANGDGVVDLADLNSVRNNFGGQGMGDTNDDGVVDLADLNNVRNNFGAMRPAPAPLASPRPSTRAEQRDAPAPAIAAKITMNDAIVSATSTEASLPRVVLSRPATPSEPLLFLPSATERPSPRRASRFATPTASVVHASRPPSLPASSVDRIINANPRSTTMAKSLAARPRPTGMAPSARAVDLLVLELADLLVDRP